MKIAALALASVLASAPALAADTPPAEKTAGQAAAADTPAPGDKSAASGAPLDYTTLTHVLGIESLRAGSHDESGVNEYYFAATMYGLLNTSEERNLEWAKRKKVTTDLGTFGDTKIESLALWRPDEKAKDFKELRVEGNTIRELAARTMTELKAPEPDIAVEVEVVMMKKAKKFIFFGNDLALAKAAYYPIPQTKFETPLRTNQTLTITDDKGTNVRITVRYDQPAAVSAPKKP